jgi:hypothetical protein
VKISRFLKNFLMKIVSMCSVSKFPVPVLLHGVSDALPLEIFGPIASFDSDLPDDVTYFSNSDCDIEAKPNLDEKVV